MATEISFSAQEWAVIRSAPHAASMAVAGAGGGILGAIKEAMAGGQAMVESAQSRSPIVQKLCTAEEIQAGQQDVQQIIMQDPSNGTPEKLKALAVQVSSQAAAILSQKAPSELSDFAALVMAVADTVSKAAKEGGFLGFGGEIVSEGERDVMSALQSALQGRGGGGGFAIPFPPQSPTQSEEPPTVPQSPSVPASPAPRTGPVGPSRSAGLPGLEPKSSTPPATNAPAQQPKSTQTQPTTPKSSTPKSSTPKSSTPKSSQSGASSKSGLSSKSKSKGGFRTGSGLRKSDQ